MIFNWNLKNEKRMKFISITSNLIFFRWWDSKNTSGQIFKKNFTNLWRNIFFFSLRSRKWRKAKIQLINKRIFQNNGSTCHRDFPGFSIEPIDNRKIWLSNRWQQLMICRCNCNKYVHIICSNTIGGQGVKGRFSLQISRRI